MLPFRSVQDQTPLEASKWLKLQLLVETAEMRELLETLAPYYHYGTTGVVPVGSGEIEKEEFLKQYATYIGLLKKGEVPEDHLFRTYFSSVLTKYREALYALPVAENNQIIRVAEPVVQLQAHRMHYSPLDGKFHIGVFGSESISWGLQISYPQLFRDPVSKKVEPVNDGERFPNTPLFKAIQKWVRQATIPTPFVINGQKMVVPVRLGKQCVEWINHHPQLAAKGISVCP